jgi:hypothetical protein
MRTLEFETELTGSGMLSIPPDVAASLSGSTHARVILILGDTEEDEDWKKLSLQQFLRGYAEEDAIYDEYDKHRTG